MQIGDTKQNNHGTEMEVVELLPGRRVKLKFKDKHGAIVETSISAYSSGAVKNPYDKTVFGIGCLGEGPYKTKINGKCPISNLVWMAMIQRCYSEKWGDRHPAYYGICSVCDEWLIYQNFASWYEENRYEVPGRLHLDKDILVPGNRVYSPETCLLVPQRINMMFLGRNRKTDRDLPTGIKRTLTGANRTKYACAFDGKTLGTFESLEEAYESYVKAKHAHIQKVVDDCRNYLPSKVYLALVDYRCPSLEEALRILKEQRNDDSRASER